MSNLKKTMGTTLPDVSLRSSIELLSKRIQHLETCGQTRQKEVDGMLEFASTLMIDAARKYQSLAERIDSKIYNGCISKFELVEEKILNLIEMELSFLKNAHKTLSTLGSPKKIDHYSEIIKNRKYRMDQHDGVAAALVEPGENVHEQAKPVETDSKYIQRPKPPPLSTTYTQEQPKAIFSSPVKSKNATSALSMKAERDANELLKSPSVQSLQELKKSRLKPNGSKSHLDSLPNLSQSSIYNDEESCKGSKSLPSLLDALIEMPSEHNATTGQHYTAITDDGPKEERVPKLKVAQSEFEHQSTAYFDCKERFTVANNDVVTENQKIVIASLDEEPEF